MTTTKTQTAKNTVNTRGALGTGARVPRRVALGVDLVGVAEAAARMGVGAASLVESLSKRKSRALVVGETGWLVDLRMLVTEEVGVHATSFEILESGDFLA